MTFTAANLGDATIQGPGDLAHWISKVSSSSIGQGSNNQNWTLSNIRYLDFDLTIGMFIDAGGVADAFN